MRFQLPKLRTPAQRVFSATIAALLVAAATITAQFAVFNEGFEGEIWELIATLDLPDVVDGSGEPVPDANWASGVAWVDGELFVADNYSYVITKYNENLQEVALPGAEWYGAAGTPTHGWAPNEAIAADVVIDNAPARKALIVSDFAASRVFAFWPDGEHIFTIGMPEPAGGAYTLGLNGVALSVGGHFKISHPVGLDPTLEIVGTLAAAWPEYYDLGVGGALIYQNTVMMLDGGTGQFEAPAPDHVLTGGVAETGNPAIPAVKALTGVTFDSAGNFYMVDSWTGRLHGYDSTFTHQFAFGTPDPSGGTTLEFEEAYGMTLWPSAAGDRLLITLPLKNQAVVYAPSPRTGVPGTIEFLFHLDGLGAVGSLPHSSAFDPKNGRVAVSDSGDNSVKVFQTPVLAVFDMKITNAGGQPVQSVCGGDNYSVTFSITVPEGRSPVQDVSPVLQLDGTATAVVPAPGDPSYGVANVGPLAPRDVITYTYSLTAPNTGIPQEIALTGSATGSTTSVGAGGDTAPVTDILDKVRTLPVLDCGAANAAPTITASVPVAPQASGWTKIEPIFPAPVSFSVTLSAADTDGTVTRIKYRAVGTNALPETEVAGPGPAIVTIVQPGVTTLYFSAQDDGFQWSPESALTIRLDNTLPSICLTIPPAAGVKSPTEWWWNGPVTIPVLVTDSQDPAPQLVAPFPPELVGGNLVFSTEGDGQVATLTALDHAGHQRAQPSNTTLDVCGPGKSGRTVNIDTTAPTASADLPTAPIHPAPATLTLSGQDPAGADGSASGVRYLDYSFDNFTTFTRVEAASAAVTLTQPVTIQFRSVDWASNIGPIVTRAYVVNNPPVVINPGTQTSAEGAAVTLPILASDPDGQALTYSAIGLPPGLSIDPVTGVITGTLPYTALPSYSVTVSATDGIQSDSETFTWNVTNTNRPPVAANDTATVVQGQSVSINVRANDTDPDGTALSVTAVGVPSVGTAVIDAATGNIVYTAPAAFVGVATFTYTVSDGAATSEATVTVTITQPPSNVPPVCTAAFTTADLWPPNHRQVYVSVAGVVDPEGQAISVKFTSILQDEPTNSVGQGNTKQDGGIENSGTQAWVRAERSGSKKVPGDGRVYLIGFTATDAGGLSCSGTVRVEVPHDQRGTPAMLSPGRWNSITGQLVTPP